MGREGCPLLPGSSRPSKLQKPLGSNRSSYIATASTQTPACPHNADRDHEQAPAGSPRRVSQGHSVLHADDLRHSPGRDWPFCQGSTSAPPSHDLEGAGINVSVGNGSFVTAKSLLLVKIRSASGCRISSCKITGSCLKAIGITEHSLTHTHSSVHYTHSRPV